MARIFTYNQDVDLNLEDKVIGSNSTDNVTKNFSVESLLQLANDENFIKHFDGIVFKALDYNSDSDQFGIVTTGTGTYTSTDFSNIQTLYLSDKNLKNEDVSEYIDVLRGYDVRITKKGDINNFGIYRVDDVTDSDSGTYKVLTVTNQDASGQLEKDAEYYISTLGNNLKNLNSFSVTSLNDVTDAGSGEIITDAERSLVNTIGNKLNVNDIVDNLESTSFQLPLSANQGRVLKGFIDSINTLLDTDDINLDELQEIVTYIKENRTTLTSLNISSISGLQTALNGKVDTVVGKGLSTEDFTTTLLQKLNNIADNAEVNVKANWGESNSALDSFIENKPTDLTVLSNHSVADLSDVTSAGSGQIITTAERQKVTNLESVATYGYANVQGNWTETNTSAASFIQNKPTILDQNTTLTINGTTNEVEVTGGAQDLSTDRTWTVGLPNNVVITSDVSASTATITNGLTAGSVDAGNILSFDTAYTGTPTNDNAIYYNTVNNHDILNFRYEDKSLKIDTLTEVIPSGITSGGNLTGSAGGTQFTIAAGTGIINDLNKESGASEPYPEIKYISWNQQTFTVTNLDSNNSEQLNAWVYVDENGNVQQQTSAFTDAQIANKIIIGSIVHSSGTVDFVKTFPITAYTATSQLAEFARMFGPLKKSGHKITANGANLSIDRASGTAFAFGRNYDNDPNSPSIVSDVAKTICKIHRYYSDGSSGHTKDTNAGAGYNTLDPTKYDNNGTLTSMNTAKFSVQRLYFFPTTPNIVVSYYGKDEYQSIGEAEQNYLLEDFTEAENTAAQAIYLGAIVLKGDATALNNSSQAKILTAGIFRSLAAVNVGGVAAASSIDDLSDVNITTVADNQILRYDSSNAQWQNETLTTDTITQGSTNLYDQTVTLSNGGNMTITGSYPNFTLTSSHPTISGAATDSTNSGTTFIQSLGFDSNGHVTSVSTGSVPSDVNTTYGISVEAGGSNTSVIRLTGNDSSTDDVTLSGGSNVTITEANDIITIASSHPNISAASSVNNSGITYIQGVTLDSNGHVTGLTSGTVPTASVTDGATTLVTGNDVYDFVINLGYSTTTGTVDTANSPGANEFARFTDANTIEGRTATELKQDLDLEIGVDIQAYDADLTALGGLAKSDGNIIVGNGSTWVAESGSTARTSLGLGTGDSPQFTGLTLTGDLVVQGTTTTVNSNTVNIGDNIITLNSDVTGTPSQDGGIELERGTSTNASLIWDESNDYWKAGLLGAEYEILTSNSTIPYSSLSGTPSINNGTLTVQGTGVLGGTGTFTANDSTSPTISITHDAVTRNNSGTGVSLSAGDSFTAIDTVYSSTEGHITGTVTKTYTLPSDLQGVTSITAGTGLSGGTITSTGTIALSHLGIQSLSDPDDDRILFWDDSAGSAQWLDIGSGLTLTGTTLSASGTTYTAGNGIDSSQLSSNVIQVETDQRTYITQLGNSSTNYYASTSTLHSWYFGGNKAMEIDSTNKDLLVAGDVVAFSTSLSDKSLKDNIVTIDNALEKVESLRGVEFDWNSGSRKDNHDIGVVAQEVETILPEIVYSKKDLDGKDVKTVDYEKITAVLIEAVKELSQEVKELKKQINK